MLFFFSILAQWLQSNKSNLFWAANINMNLENSPLHNMLFKYGKGTWAYCLNQHLLASVRLWQVGGQMVGRIRNQEKMGTYAS